MNQIIRTSAVALTALAGLGSALLVSATPADAAVARGAAVRSVTKTSISLPAIGNILPAKVIKTGINLPTGIPQVFVHPTTTGTSAPFGATGTKGTGATGSANAVPASASTVLPGSTTGSGGGVIKMIPSTATTPSTGTTPSTTSASTPTTTSATPSTSTNAPSTTTSAPSNGMRPGNYQMRPQYAGRPGYGTYAPAMYQAPTYAAPAPAYAAPAPAVAAQPYAPAPAPTSCMRQAMTPDGQVVTFDICTNQAVVGPAVQAQPQPQQPQS